MCPARSIAVGDPHTLTRTTDFRDLCTGDDRAAQRGGDGAWDGVHPADRRQHRRLHQDILLEQQADHVGIGEQLVQAARRDRLLRLVEGAGNAGQAGSGAAAIMAVGGQIAITGQEGRQRLARRRVERLVEAARSQGCFEQFGQMATQVVGGLPQAQRPGRVGDEGTAAAIDQDLQRNMQIAAQAQYAVMMAGNARRPGVEIEAGVEIHRLALPVRVGEAIPAAHGPDAPADPVARLQHGDVDPARLQFARGDQPRDARAKDDDAPHRSCPGRTEQGRGKRRRQGGAAHRPQKGTTVEGEAALKDWLRHGHTRSPQGRRAEKRRDR
nr:hypothetical protein [Sphingobium sp. BYY-5]